MSYSQLRHKFPYIMFFFGFGFHLQKQSCVVDRHRFDADPDRIVVDPNPTPSFSLVGKSTNLILLVLTARQFTLFYLSLKRKRCIIFNFRL